MTNQHESRESVRQRLKHLWVNLPLRGKGLTVTLIPVVPLIVMALLLYTGEQRERDADASVVRTLEAKVGLDTVMTLLVDAETGARGYLLTADEQFLDPYQTAIRELSDTLASLQPVMSDASQLQRLEQLRGVIMSRLDILTLTIQSSRPDGHKPAQVPQELLGDGRSLMDRVRGQLATMQSVEDNLLAERRARAEDADRRSMVLTFTGTAIGAVGGLFATLLFTAGISRRVDSVQRNARRLADDCPLLPSPEGEDEIGQLGRTLQEAAVLLASRGREVRETSEEIDRFFSLSLDLYCIAGFDGYFKKVNPSWTQTLGWTADELMAQPYVEFIHPDDRPLTAKEARDLSTGTATLNFENRYRTKDGSYRWLEWKAFPFVEQGVIYAGARDITEQKATEELVQKARQDAERASRAKNEFLSRMSHDLRTPLNVILGFAQLLETETLATDQRDSVKQILKGGRHLLDLINEILELARIESGRLALSPEAVSVDQMVQEVADLVRPLAAERSIEIQIDGMEGESYVFADRQRTRQVLLNLFSNAVKYNHDRGRVTVGWQEVSTERCRVTVTDTGPGIRPEKLQLLFQPFERLGAEQTMIEGTGLGLSVAKGLVEAMGGTMGVDSEVDRGTTFWFELSRAAAPEAASPWEANDEPRAAEDPGIAGTVLYIEDNPSNRQLMERVIARRPGVRLLSAAQGETGIALARTSHPDLIFLDLHLPAMPGEEVLRRLWADPKTRAIPVAILSADATPGQIRRLLAAGACAYLTKPLDIRQVLRLLDEKVTGESTQSQQAWLNPLMSVR